MVQSGRHMASSGFSVHTEHAHQYQEQLPFKECWDKEHLPITNTAGVATRNARWTPGPILIRRVYMGYPINERHKRNMGGNRSNNSSIHLPVCNLYNLSWLDCTQHRSSFRINPVARSDISRVKRRRCCFKSRQFSVMFSAANIIIVTWLLLEEGFG